MSYSLNNTILTLQKIITEVIEPDNFYLDIIRKYDDKKINMVALVVANQSYDTENLCGQKIINDCSLRVVLVGSKNSLNSLTLAQEIIKRIVKNRNLLLDVKIIKFGNPYFNGVDEYGNFIYTSELLISLGENSE